MNRAGSPGRAVLLASVVVMSALAPVACARPPLSVHRMPPLARDGSTRPPLDGFIAREFRQNSNAVPYRLFVPPTYTSARKYPVVVWLHGGGGIGTDNFLNITNDQVPGTRLWTTPEQQAKQPAFVLVPQANGAWAYSDSGARPVDIVPAMLAALAKEFAIDTTRLYVAGQSLGGAGAWELMRTQPTLFAAGLVLCPAVTTFRAGVRTPVWIFVGDQDSPTIVQSARQMRDSIAASGGSLRYTEYPGLGHDIWERSFKEPGLADWLFDKRR
jgi:predicted peptidase